MVPAVHSTRDTFKTGYKVFQFSFPLYVAVRAYRGNLEDGVVGGDLLQSLHVPILATF